MYSVSEIHKQFRDGNLSGVMEGIEEYLPTLPDLEQRQAVHLMSRYNGLERNHNLGVLDPNDYRTESNRIRLATWDLVRELKDVPTPSEASRSTTIGNPDSLYNKVKHHAAQAPEPPPSETEADDGAAHLFISYAREDREFVDELLIALASLRANGWISDWTDSSISPGAEWQPAIETNLRKADIVIYIVSADFLASGFIRNSERRWAEEEREKRGITILPVIARPSTWQLEAFSKYNVVPVGPDNTVLPISRWEDEDEAYLAVVEALIEVVKAKQ